MTKKLNLILLLYSISNLHFAVNNWFENKPPAIQGKTAKRLDGHSCKAISITTIKTIKLCR